MSTADKLSKLLETKEAIKQAIIDKGGTVGDVFADYPTAIQNIQSGGSGTFVVPAELRFAYSQTIESFPEDWDWSEIENETDLSNMFYYCQKLTKIPKLKLTDLRNGSSMFNYCKVLSEIDTSEWNTSNLDTATGMFARCNFTTIPPIDTSNVKTMDDMFGYCQKLKEVTNFDSSNATKMTTLFSNCTKLQTVSELDTSKITSNFSSYNNPFYNCYALRNFEGFKGLKVTMYLDSCYSLSYDSMINVINKLESGVSGKTLYLNQDLVNQLSDDDIAIATSKGWTISPAKNITSPVVVTTLSQIPTKTYHITPKNYDFSQFSGSLGGSSNSALPNRSNLYLFYADLSNTTGVEQAFSGASNLRYVSLTGTRNITYAYKMFSGCNCLMDVYIEDASNITRTDSMFSQCRDLEEVDFSEWNVKDLTDSNYMFAGCNSLKKANLSGWNTSNLTNTNYMFNDCYALEEIDLSGWDFDKLDINSRSRMFNKCESLKKLTMTGKPWTTTDPYAFGDVPAEGVLYYNPEYDYSAVIAELPATWTAVPLTE